MLVSKTNQLVREKTQVHLRLVSDDKVPVSGLPEALSLVASVLSVAKHRLPMEVRLPREHILDVQAEITEAYDSKDVVVITELG
jgi:predicted transcriptional regulator